MYQRLSASVVSSMEVPDTWPTAKVISQPNVPGTSLDECILALTSLKDGYCSGILREEVDKLPSEMGGQTLTATRAFNAVNDRWTCFVGGCGGGGDHVIGLGSGDRSTA